MVIAGRRIRAVSHIRQPSVTMERDVAHRLLRQELEKLIARAEQLGGKMTMTVDHRRRGLVLVLEDDRETATLIRSLLTSSGFCVTLAEDEEAAILRARVEAPDVIVICLGLETDQLIAVADRIRANAGSTKQLPIVIFSVQTIPEGSEIEVRRTTYLARPDDFNQLRRMLDRLLSPDWGSLQGSGSGIH